MARVRIKLPPLWENPAASADQKRFIESPARIAVAATGTKVGKTLGAAIWIIRFAIANPGALCWWVAPYRRTARIGFDRVVSLLPPHKIVTNESNLMVTLSNGSKIEFRTAENPDTLYGEGVHAAVLDEAARMREKAWIAVNTTMLQTRGPMRICSNTDKGRRNWLYKLFLRGQQGDPEVMSYHIRTTEAPHFMEGGTPGPKAVAEMKKNLGPIAYEALVLAEFPEDAATVFPGLSKVICDGLDEHGLPTADLSKVVTPFRPAPMLVPPQGDGVYVGGGDLANRRDWTVITTMDAISGLIVYWKRMQRVKWAEQIAAFKHTQDLYRCPFLIDSTPGSVGDPLLEQMQVDGIAADGYEFTNKTKGWLIDRMAISIQEQEVWIPRSLEVLIAEMESLEREVTESGNVKYHAPDEEGATDDGVMSACLANWQRDTRVPAEYSSGGPRNPERGGRGRTGF